MQERRTTSQLIRGAEVSFIERRDQATTLFDLGLLARDINVVASELRRQGLTEQAEIAYAFRGGVLVDALKKKRELRFEGLKIGKAKIRKVNGGVANRVLFVFSNENGEKIELMETFTRMQSICGSSEKADTLVNPLDIRDVRKIHEK